MARRTYRQYCAAARALDVVGERWTLLIVRELLFSPRRYTDLLRSLPGIGTNLLATRLAELEESGVVARRNLPPPASSTVYELTELGRSLEEVLLALSRWGRRLLEQRRPSDHFRLRWFMLGMRTSFRPESARHVDETYEFRIGGETLHAVVRDGSLATFEGAAEDPALVVTAEPDDFVAVALGRLDPAEAIGSGLLEVEGKPAAVNRCLKIFAPPRRDPVAEAARG